MGWMEGVAAARGEVYGVELSGDGGGGEFVVFVLAREGIE